MLFDKVCVHTFSQGGQHLVVDGNSGAVHVVDGETLTLIKRICDNDRIHGPDDLKELLEI